MQVISVVSSDDIITHLLMHMGDQNQAIYFYKTKDSLLVGFANRKELVNC